MYDLKLLQVNHGLVKAIKVVAACKRMVGPKSEVWGDLLDIDREIRAAASECQRVLELAEADENRPLLTMDG